MIFASKFLKVFLFSAILVMLTACGGGGSTTKLTAQEIAIEKIAKFALDGITLPTIQDYEAAGLDGIDEDNLDKINEAVKGLSYEDVDTQVEIQTMLDGLDLTIADISKPIITLNGINPVAVLQGSVYTDAGATAIDDIDGKLEVTTSGSVDTNVVKDYTLTYTAEDKAGNTATASRKVTVISSVEDCAQVITHAYNPTTSEEKDFPTPCDVPDGWIVGNVPDTTKPVITLNGKNPVTIKQGESYVEAGATATDDKDSNVSVELKGTVNKDKLGVYTITYTAKDKAGNKATETRTVNVISQVCDQVITHAYNPTTGEEKDYPTPCDVPDGWIVGNAPADTTKPVITLKGQNPITIKQGESYVEAGATATDDKDGNVSVELKGTVNKEEIAVYTITYTAKDKAGNKATETRTVNVISQVCAQVITHAYNPETGEEKDYPTPCDVPDGWVVGTPPVEEDAIPPVITRLGSASVNITVGDVYDDAGATASDNKDGDITNDIDTDNPVNTAVASTYTITYNVDDTAGNHAPQITRSVTVSPVVNRVYGAAGESEIADAIVSENGNSVIIMPVGVSEANPVPVVFFAPGFRNKDYTKYQTLLNFIASHGYAVIFANDIDGFSADSIMTHIKEMVNTPAIKPLLDTSRIGVIGHSSGGGHGFRILKEFSDNNNEGWGVNGRFLLALEPWFAFNMTEADMKTLPSNSNIVIQQYGEGGNNKESDTDARIALTEYYLLDSIADAQKDYQVFVNADHGYPNGGVEYSEMQGILKPLDALMELTFKDTPAAGAQQVALEVGNDDPYNDGKGIQVVKLISDYHYKCHGANTIINYCAIHQGALPPESEFAGIATNTTKPKPNAIGKSFVGQEFGKKITRFTNRVNETYNDHPYSKTQAWNSDMTMIRMSYRWYDAETLQELPITSGTNVGPELYYINGALSEKKWSNVYPNVFYGVSGSKFKKGTINAARDEISFDTYDLTPDEGSYDKFTLGKYEGNIDFNDKYVVFAARKTGDKYLTAIVYDIQNNTVRKKLDFPEVSWPDEGQVFDWMSVSPLGNHILMSTGGKVHQYDIDLNLVRELSSAAGHGDLGVDQDGVEAYVQYEYGANSGIWIYRLSDGHKVRLLPDKYNGGHLSCRNYNRRGWCYASTNSQTYREVFAIKLDYSGPDNHIVNRFAQSHDSGHHSMVNVSPDGKRILFFSDWGDTSVPWEEKDTYLVK